MECGWFEVLIATLSTNDNLGFRVLGCDLYIKLCGLAIRPCIRELSCGFWADLGLQAVCRMFTETLASRVDEYLHVYVPYIDCKA